jgi:hypothetical protein
MNQGFDWRWHTACLAEVSVVTRCKAENTEGENENILVD